MGDSRVNLSSEKREGGKVIDHALGENSTLMGFFFLYTLGFPSSRSPIAKASLLFPQLTHFPGYVQQRNSADYLGEQNPVWVRSADPNVPTTFLLSQARSKHRLART